MEEMDCTVFNDSGTIADTTTAAAADVPDAVSTYTWTDNLTPLGHHARNVPNPGPSVFNSDLAFQGNYAYQGTYDGFRCIDISEPGEPDQVVNSHGLHAPARATSSSTGTSSCARGTRR